MAAARAAASSSSSSNETMATPLQECKAEFVEAAASLWDVGVDELLASQSITMEDILHSTML
eukprot:3285737-Alexandrium_andersonii.AAC.1